MRSNWIVAPFFVVGQLGSKRPILSLIAGYLDEPIPIRHSTGPCPFGVRWPAIRTFEPFDGPGSNHLASSERPGCSGPMRPEGHPTPNWLPTTYAESFPIQTACPTIPNLAVPAAIVALFPYPNLCYLLAISGVLFKRLNPAYGIGADIQIKQIDIPGMVIG